MNTAINTVTMNHATNPCVRPHPNARAIVYGHTHTMVVDDDAHPVVMNPGAAGETRTRGGSSCLVLTASESNWHVEKFRFAENESVA